MSNVPSNYVGTTDLWGNDYDDQSILPMASKWSPLTSSAHEYVWQDDAACQDSDPDLFDIAQDGDPSIEWRNRVRRDKRVGLTKINLARYERARLICEACPVKGICLSSADPSDLYWSVRGGQMPGQLKASLAGPASKRADRRPPTFRYGDYVESGS